MDTGSTNLLNNNDHGIVKHFVAHGLLLDTDYFRAINKRLSTNFLYFNEHLVLHVFLTLCIDFVTNSPLPGSNLLFFVDSITGFLFGLPHIMH